MKPFSTGVLSGALKPKYRLINNILGEGFNPRGLDVFIDLNTLVSSMSTSQKFMSSLPFATDVEKDIVSTLLFTFKHWKDFTRKYDDVRIFMIANDMEMSLVDESEISKAYLVPMVNKYRQDRYKKFKEYWSAALAKVSVILKYIPNAYVINCNRFDSFVIPEILSNSSERYKIIVSSSSLMTNYTYIPHTFVLYSRYTNQGMTQLTDPIMIVQSISKIDDPIMSTFCQNRVFYNLLNTIIGDYERGIIGLSTMGITSFATDLLRAVERSEIPSNPMNVESVMDVIQPQFHQHVRNSYPLVDITTHASMIKQSNIEKIKATMIDQIDVEGLQSLSIDGLNLLELM